MKNIIKLLWKYSSIFYFPIYIIAWILHKIARLLLAISYFGMLDWRIGKDILNNLFKWHGKH